MANGVTGGWGGLGESALGWLAGAALLAVQFALGAMGGGDLKLMAAIGALQGPHVVLLTAVYTALVGGVLAVVELVRARGIKSAVRYLVGGRRGGVPGAAPSVATIAYGPAIAAGAIIVLFRY